MDSTKLPMDPSAKGQIPEKKEILYKSGANAWFLLLLVPAAGGLGYALFEIHDFWLKIFMGGIAAIFGIGLLLSLGNVFSNAPALTVDKKGLKIKGDPFYPWGKIKQASISKATSKSSDNIKHFLEVFYYENENTLGRRELDLDDMEIAPELLQKILIAYQREYIKSKQV